MEFLLFIPLADRKGRFGHTAIKTETEQSKQQKKMASKRVIKFTEKFDSMKFGINYRIFSGFADFLTDDVFFKIILANTTRRERESKYR